MRVKMYQCGGETGFSEYPIGLGYLKSNCTSFDHQVEVVTNPDHLTDCDLVGLSTNAWGIKEAVGLMAKAHNRGLLVAVGGQGTLWGPISELGFDWVVVGEGEQVLRAILDGKVPRGSVIRGPNVPDIDTLAFPVRGKCGPIVPFLSSRGCPYNCHFCSSTSFWGKGARFHSPDYVVAEIERILKEYPHVKEVYSLDDLFVAPRARFEQIYNLWMRKGWHNRLKIRGWVRVDLLDLQLAKMMKAMGFKNIRFGMESGSDRMLKAMNKGITVAQVQRAIDIARQVGLPTNISWMTGLPGETDEDRQLTAAFVKKNRIPPSYRFRAWPGSKFYNGEDMLAEDMRQRDWGK